MESRWQDRDAAGLDELGLLTYRSNLLGRDPTIVNYGGGNTSVKGRIADHTGRLVRAMWVKGSGSDLATLTADDVTVLRGQIANLRRKIEPPEGARRHYIRTEPGIGYRFDPK